MGRNKEWRKIERMEEGNIIEDDMGIGGKVRKKIIGSIRIEERSDVIGERIKKKINEVILI